MVIGVWTKMLKIENLNFSVTKNGKLYKILDDINLYVKRNEMLVITGPNGSGKSTLVKALMGIYQTDTGNVILDGKNINNLDIGQRARAGIGFAFQQPPRFKGMTVEQFISISAGEKKTETACCELLSRVGLCAKDYLSREVDGTLSGGEMKRLEMVSILSQPHKLCIFDEPEAGIDLWSFDMLIKEFEEMRKNKNQSIIIISHQEKIIGMADQVVVMENGKVAGIGRKNNNMISAFNLMPGCCTYLERMESKSL